jgi:HYR domain
VPGLGGVKETLTEKLHHGPPLCSENNVKFLGFPARWVVANKGEIDFALAPSPECFSFGPTLAFTVTGGTGVYTGASGSGTFSEVARLGNDGKWRGSHTWTGTLVVPAASFDLTPPTFTGAADKVVAAPKKVKRVRVSFNVTARDDVDGSVPVKCTPGSGSRFKVGKTRVSCTATDKSSNAATTQFTITVKARR